MFVLLLAFSLLILLLFYFAYEHKQYWKRRGVPGPEPRLFIGNFDILGCFVKNSHPLLYEKLTKKYGPYFGLQRGLTNTLVVSDPQMVSEVMRDKFECFHGRDHAPIFWDEDFEKFGNVFLVRGKRWKRLRAISSSAFSGQNLRKIYSQLKDCASTFIENLEQDVKEKGNIVDVKKNFHEYTADIMFRLAAARQESREFIQKFIPSIQSLIQMSETRVQFWSWILPMFFVPILKVIQQVQIFTTNFTLIKFISQLQSDLKERREEKKNPDQPLEMNNFFDIFSDAENNDIKLENNETYDKRNSQITKHLIPDEVLGQLFLFMFAGYDTTASTLSFVCYFLAKHPEIQEKLRQEIFEVCGKNEDPDYDQLQKLKYSDSVLKETLRLIPIGAVVLSRKCNQTTTLGNVLVEKGTNVLLDVFSIHKNVDVWGEDAEMFKPERWLQEDSAKYNAHFYGFGNSPRQCVGMKLAYLEERLALVKLLQRFRLHKTPEIEDAMQISGFVLTPKSVILKLERL